MIILQNMLTIFRMIPISVFVLFILLTGWLGQEMLPSLPYISTHPTLFL